MLIFTFSTLPQIAALGTIPQPSPRTRWVYTQGSFNSNPQEPNPQPLLYKGRGGGIKALFRIGEGFGERSDYT